MFSDNSNVVRPALSVEPLVSVTPVDLKEKNEICYLLQTNFKLWLKQCGHLYRVFALNNQFNVLSTFKVTCFKYFGILTTFRQLTQMIKVLSK